jgi:hypothetical protein
MCEALAALQLGFLSRQVRNSQETMWGRLEHAVPAVSSILTELDRALHGLSNRMNGYQRSTVLEKLQRLYDSHSIIQQRLAECDGVASILKTKQQELWSDFRAMLVAITAGDQRLVAWFDIGDHLADISWQVSEGRLPLPLTRQQWGYIYSGVDRLPKRERWFIEPFFPEGYKDPEHLACQLMGTYQGLCGLLQSFGDNLTANPQWNGTAISYRRRGATLKRQSNGVIALILDECERLGWPDVVALPSNLQGDVKQAIYHFNKLGVIRLFLRGKQITWR